MHRIPEGSVWKQLRSLPGELLRLGRIAAHGQCQRRTPQSPHGLAITRQRVGTRIGLFKFGGGVRESMVQRCLRGSPVQFARLATLAKSILIGRLQAKAEVLHRLACEPLNLPRSGRIIALNVSDFEEALVDPRSAESLPPRFLR